MTNEILFIRDYTIAHTKVDSPDIENIIGQKAYGLCLMPWAWTLPFFVIDKSLVKYIISNRVRAASLYQYVTLIKEACQQLGIDNQLIIRSSGIKEGMFERGQYESKVSSLETVIEDIVELAEQLAVNNEVRRDCENTTNI